MTLRRWDLVFVPSSPSDEVGHPAVVLSAEDILDDPRQLRINILTGTKKTPATVARPQHVLLNGADGLDFSTLINCALVFMVEKAHIRRAAGRVSLMRRQEIARKVRAYLGLG